MTARWFVLAPLCWALAATAADSGSAAAAPLPPLATVTTLDLDRYMGRWYEIARFPNRFQRQCAAAATADYSLQPEGGVRVVNRCPVGDGQVDQAVGEARRIGAAGSPRLQVRFAPAWLSLLPFVWGDYWVVDLDPQYQLAAVSEPQREFLWILARQPVVAPAQWDALLGRLRQQGFDLSRLQPAGPGR